MPIARTLQRVADDVAAGRYGLARQRLRGLIGSLPERLDVRERLAEVYRLEGDAAQAGRWSYLRETPDADELAAFESAYGNDAIRIMKALSWRQGEDAAPSEVVRTRLAALRARAEQESGGPVSWDRPVHPPAPTHWWEPVAMVGCGLVALALVALVVIGLGSLAAHGLNQVIGWFD